MTRVLVTAVPDVGEEVEVVRHGDDLGLTHPFDVRFGDTVRVTLTVEQARAVYAQLAPHFVLHSVKP